MSFGNVRSAVQARDVSSLPAAILGLDTKELSMAYRYVTDSLDEADMAKVWAALAPHLTWHGLGQDFDLGDDSVALVAALSATKTMMVTARYKGIPVKSMMRIDFQRACERAAAPVRNDLIEAYWQAYLREVRGEYVDHDGPEAQEFFDSREESFASHEAFRVRVEEAAAAVAATLEARRAFGAGESLENPDLEVDVLSLVQGWPLDLHHTVRAMSATASVVLDAAADIELDRADLVNGWWRLAAHQQERHRAKAYAAICQDLADAFLRRLVRTMCDKEAEL